MKTASSSNCNLVFLGVALMAVMINVDLNATNLALATIGRVLHVPLTMLQWVIIVYILFGIPLLVISGKLGDVFGRKKIYLFGVSLFVIASIVCGCATGIRMLLVGRALQGLAFGFTLSLGLVIVTSVFPSARRGTVLGMYTMVAGLSQALGPFVGGFILQFFGWRWLFLINIPLGIGCAALLVAYFREDHKLLAVKLDYLGASIFFSGLVLSVLALNEMSTWGASSILFTTTFGLGLALLLCFYTYEKHLQHPLVDFSVYKNRTYLFVTIIRAINTYAWFSVIFLLPLFFQNILELTPVATGMMILVMTAMYGLLSPFVGRWLDWYGYKKPLVLSVIFGIAACLLLVNMKLTITWWLLLGFLLFGINKAITLPCTVGLALKNLPKEKAGVGLGVFYATTFMGGICGVAITGTTIILLSRIKLHAGLIKLGLTQFVKHAALLKGVASGAVSVAVLKDYFPPGVLEKILPIIKHAFVYGAITTLWIVIVLSFITLVLSFYVQDAG
ncbi:MAG: MFS transporter [Gammaproteobacteria bacterium]|nr:MFS transporter [Gammaproteobacteria bacterium]